MGQNLEDTRHKLPRVISLLSYQDVPISPLSKSGTTCEMLSSRTRVSLDSVPNAFMAHQSHRQAPPSMYQIPRRKASFQHEPPCTNTLGPGNHTQGMVGIQVSRHQPRVSHSSRTFEGQQLGLLYAIFLHSSYSPDLNFWHCLNVLF